MNRNEEVLKSAILHALSGEGAHVGSRGVFDSLDWKLAGNRPTGTPRSLFQLLNHVVYWQNWVVKWLNGKRPATPAHASGSWPGGVAPSSRKEWERAVRDFRRGLEALERGAHSADLLSKHGQKSRLEMLQAIASHNSYHLGQAVLLRQLVDAWPPPSGGLTW